MGILSALIRPLDYRATYAPDDNFWYTPDPRNYGGGTEAGVGVSAESAMRLSAVNACVRLLSDMIGTLPLKVYRRLDNEGKEPAPTNPVYPLLHRQPNVRQTAKEWLSMGGAHLLLRGNFYSQIVLDGRGAVAQLFPLHPDRVKVELLRSGRRGYVYRQPEGGELRLTQDEVFHVMGLSLDGVVGCSVIEFAREAIAAGTAQEGFAARFWRQGAEGHLAFISPAALSKTAREENEKALRDRFSGWRNAHAPILLEGGMKPERISVSNRDAQYIDARRFSVTDICRFFGVPPHMVGETDASTSWGSGIEQMTIGFVNFTLLPWLVTIEQAADRDLILADNHFAQFTVDALLRGEAGARATAHRQYVDGGIKSVNEIRIIENLNPLPGAEYDEPHRAGNLGGTPGGGNPETTRLPDRTPAVPAPTNGNRRAELVIGEVAARLVRRETTAIRRWAPRYTGDRAGWVAWVTTFFGEQAAALERDLALEQATARAYCAEHCSALLSEDDLAGVEAMLGELDLHGATRLAALALEEATP